MICDLLCAPILLGFGLDEFSVSSKKILKIKKIIRGIFFF
ncbi:MAG: hypothetical protein LBJ68_01820 [Endomicrobium sp.]|nr:hypothetical protein [Endomicrobium sp.]